MRLLRFPVYGPRITPDVQVIEELREQTEMFNCNGGVYTQTTDVEGEVNGASLW